MFLLGILTFSITLLVAWLSGDTEAVTRGNPYYAVPLAVGAWMMFAPLRRSIWGKA